MITHTDATQDTPHEIAVLHGRAKLDKALVERVGDLVHAIFNHNLTLCDT